VPEASFASYFLVLTIPELLLETEITTEHQDTLVPLSSGFTG
jgi:hypothetical protein